MPAGVDPGERALPGVIRGQLPVVMRLPGALFRATPSLASTPGPADLGCSSHLS